MKYNEDKIVKEIHDYIKGTYGEHYSTTKDGTQVQDMLRHIILIKIFVRQMQLNTFVGLVKKQVVIEKTC